MQKLSEMVAQKQKANTIFVVKMVVAGVLFLAGFISLMAPLSVVGLILFWIWIKKKLWLKILLMIITIPLVVIFIFALLFEFVWNTKNLDTHPTPVLSQGNTITQIDQKTMQYTNKRLGFYIRFPQIIANSANNLMPREYLTVFEDLPNKTIFFAPYQHVVCFDQQAYITGGGCWLQKTTLKDIPQLYTYGTDHVQYDTATSWNDIPYNNECSVKAKNQIGNYYVASYVCQGYDVVLSYSPTYNIYVFWKGQMAHLQTVSGQGVVPEVGFLQK
jgi:hypothetical protein